MREELLRVGLEAEVLWSFPNPFERALAKSLKMGFDSAAYLNMDMSHYRAIKTARELGAKSLLIMEDDCRFLKDVSRLEEGLSALPQDYDVAMLDSFNYWCYREEEHRKLLSGRVNDWWCRCAVKRCSTACYALSGKGIERFVELYEAAAVGKEKLLVCDQYFEERWLKGLNFYCAFPNLAIQCRTPKTTSGYETIAGIYKAEGLREEDYAAY